MKAAPDPRPHCSFVLRTTRTGLQLCSRPATAHVYGRLVCEWHLEKLHDVIERVAAAAPAVLGPGASDEDVAHVKRRAAEKRRERTDRYGGSSRRGGR